MNVLIVSNNEAASFRMIYNCVLKIPENVHWQILGNIQYHQKLISVFGRDCIIDIPIPQLHKHLQENNASFPFLKEIPEKSIIIPTDFESLRFLAKNKHSFHGHTVCPLMEESLLDYLDNKSNQKTITTDCNVLSPSEYLYSQLKNIPETQRLVVKPNLGAASDGVFISQNRQQAIDYYESLSPEDREKHIIQDYIAGDDYFYYAICYNGKIYLSCIIKPGLLSGRLRYLGAVFVKSLKYDEIAKKIAGYYNYSGPISIDFRVTKKPEDIYLIEINPRNGSNCYLFSAAHINWLLELARISETPDIYEKSYDITINNKCFSSFKIALLDIFLKLKFYIS